MNEPLNEENYFQGRHEIGKGKKISRKISKTKHPDGVVYAIDVPVTTFFRIRKIASSFALSKTGLILDRSERVSPV